MRLRRYAVSEFRQSPPPAPAPASIDDAERIFILVRVNSKDALRAHHELSLCGISSIGIDPAANVCRHRCITFRVSLGSRALDGFMHEVMERLPEAEFGRIIPPAAEAEK
jgi:hypothetical protein